MSAPSGKDVPASEREGATQLTQPKKGKPAEIPVPKREDFQRLFKRAASSRKHSPSRD